MNTYTKTVINRSITLRAVQVMRCKNSVANKEKIIRKLNSLEAGMLIAPNQLVLKYVKILRIKQSQLLNFNPQYMTLNVDIVAITYLIEKNAVGYAYLSKIRPDGNGFGLMGPSKVFIHKSCLPGNNFTYLPRQNSWSNTKTGVTIRADNLTLLRLKITDVTHSESRKNKLKVKGSLKIPYGGDISWY